MLTSHEGTWYSDRVWGIDPVTVMVWSSFIGGILNGKYSDQRL